MRRVDGKSNKYKQQTDWLQECDMPHSQGVRLCLLDSEFSMLAQALAKVQVEVYQIKKKKKLTFRYRHQTPVFTLTQTEHLPSVLDTVQPSPALTFT